MAAEWRLTKGFEAGATLGDDVDASDGETRDETLISLSPFFLIAGSGRRADLSLSGEVALLRFVNEERDEVDPRLFFTSRAILVQRFAELDASARVSRRSVLADPLVGDEPTRRDETENVYEIDVGPTISHLIGRQTRYEAGYRFSAARGSSDEIVGSDVHKVSAEVSSAVGEGVITVGGGYELARFDSDRDTRSGSIGVGASYRLRPVLIGSVSVGYDRVDTGDVAGSVDGEFWNVGLRWQPSERLSVQTDYGERAYGRKPSVAVALTGRRSAIELAWSRDLAFATDVGANVLQPPVGGVSDSEGFGDGAPGSLADDFEDGFDSDLGTGSGGGLGGGPDDDESLAPLGRDAGSIDEVVVLTFRLSGRRTTLSMSFEQARREQLDGAGPAATGLGYGLGLRRLLSRRVEAAADWSAVENRISGDRERENRLRLSIRVSL